MADKVTKRVASIFLEDGQPKNSLRGLTAESRKLYNELSKLPRGSAEFVAKSKEFKRVQADLKGVKDEVQGSNSVFGSLGKTIGGLGPATIAAMAGAAVLGSAKKSIDAWRESEKAVAKVEQAIKSTGSAAGLTLEQLKAEATDLQHSTLFGDEQILNDATAQLLTFTNIAGDNLTRTQKVALDLSTVLDGDLKSASIQLGKALNDPVANLSALSRSGIQFSADQKAVINELATTNRLAEAQGVILKELERQYGGQAEAAARADGGYTQLNNSVGDLFEAIGSWLSGDSSDFINDLRSMVDTITDWIGVNDKASDKLQEQRIEMNALFTVLKSGNITTEQQSELVERINKDYKAYLPTAISVTDSTEALEAAQRGANMAMMEQIQLLARKELLEEAQKDAVDAQRDALEAQIKLQQVAQGDIGLWDRIKAGGVSAGQAVAYFSYQSKAAQEDAANAAKEYENLVTSLGSVDAARKAAAGGPGGDTTTAPPAPSNEDAELVTKKAAEVRDAIKAAQKEMADARLEGAAKEIRAVEDKYQKLAEKAEGSGVGLEEIEEAQAQELAAIRQKYGAKELERLKKLDADIRKLRDAQFAARMSVEQKAEVDAINANYEAQRTALEGNSQALAELDMQRSAELDALKDEQRTERQGAANEAELQQIRDKYTKVLEEAQGHKDRLLELQDLLNIELEAKALEQETKRQEALAAKQAAEDEWAASTQQREVDRAQQELDLLTARQEAELEAATNQGLALNDLLLLQAEERAPLVEELRMAEMDALNAHFDELYAAADAAGFDTTDLQRQHGEALLLMKQDFAQQEVAQEKEKNAKIIADEQAQAQAKTEVLQGIVGISNDLFQAAAGDADEAADFRKMLTLFQIGIDTAAAISSLTAMSEANPGNAVSGGLAGVVQFVAGFARITANVAKATQLLSKPKPKAPAFAVGGATGEKTGGFFGRRNLNSTLDQGTLLSYFDAELGANVDITKPPAAISKGGKVSEPTLGLFGEKGAEWVAPNWQFSHPTLQPVFAWLENMRSEGRVPAYAVGGVTTSTRLPQRATTDSTSSARSQVAGGVDTTSSQQAVHMQAMETARLNATITRLSDLLESGIKSTISNDLILDNDDRLTTIQNGADIIN